MGANKKDYIVIVSFCPFPYGDASDNAIYTFMSGFNEHGVDGEVLCAFPNLPLAHKGIPAVGEYCGVKYRYLHGRTCRSKIRIWNRISYFLFLPFLRKYIKDKLKTYNLTVLFVAQVGRIFYKASKLCQEEGAKVVLVSCEYPFYLREQSEKRIKKFNKFSSHIDKYIFETRTLDQYSRGILDSDIDSIVIPATMPFEDILLSKKVPSEPYIAYCGSIYSEAKDGLSNIIRAFSTFHKSHPEVRLKFVGRITNPGYFTDLQQLAEELKIQDLISYTGEVSREEYVHYLKNANMMMVAKPVNSFYGGGLSSKVVEYLFSGNPVLMVAADDYVDYLTHRENVYFVEDNHPETLSAALYDLYANPEMMKSIGLNGREFALEHFNYHILTKGLLEFLLN